MTDGIWDNGEWISWNTINHQLNEIDLRERYPHADFMLIRIFEDLVDLAEEYYDITGRYLPVFGELGEIFAEITFGIKRHKPRVQGSDGLFNNDHIEIKTITPEKKSKKVKVKRSGNFNKLLVVKIDENFDFEARMLHKKHIVKGSSGKTTVSWSRMKTANKNLD